MDVIEIGTLPIIKHIEIVCKLINFKHVRFAMLFEDVSNIHVFCQCRFEDKKLVCCNVRPKTYRTWICTEGTFDWLLFKVIVYILKGNMLL